MPYFSLNIKKFMNRIFVLSIKILLIFILASFYSYKAYADETDLILKQLQILQEDIKTLEKAVYSEDVKTTLSDTELFGKSSDVLTKHLLKLSELEEQFKILTNNFEEINFKLDKLSSRITKVQTDNQMRFQDLEKSGISKSSGSTTSVAKKLPGSGEAKDLGKALEIILGARDWDADEAEKFGTINKALDPDEIDDYVARLAQRISKFPAESITASKRAVYASIDLPIQEALKEEAYQLFQATSKTPAVKRFQYANDNAAQFNHDNQKNWEQMIIDIQEVN